MNRRRRIIISTKNTTTTSPDTVHIQYTGEYFLVDLIRTAIRMQPHSIVIKEKDIPPFDVKKGKVFTERMSSVMNFIWR